MALKVGPVVEEQPESKAKVTAQTARNWVRMMEWSRIGFGTPPI
ncbi:hypothetical protein [Caballeronia hypogeia]|nr:hypothetical protein [Caballeronia hypogeia]